MRDLLQQLLYRGGDEMIMYNLALCLSMRQCPRWISDSMVNLLHAVVSIFSLTSLYIHSKTDFHGGNRTDHWRLTHRPESNVIEATLMRGRCQHAGFADECFVWILEVIGHFNRFRTASIAASILSISWLPLLLLLLLPGYTEHTAG